MSETHPLERSQLEQWLSRAGIDYYICDQCNGLHLAGLQELEGVVDSRIFVEPWGLLISTELVVRPVALLPLVADLSRLNIDYPTLKLFLDIVDDAMPQLVAGATHLTGAGFTEAQFRHFVATAMESVRQLVSESRHLDYLLPDEDAEQNPQQPRVH